MKFLALLFTTLLFFPVDLAYADDDQGEVVTHNALRNPGFETGHLHPWYANGRDPHFPPGSLPWTVTRAEAHSGRWSVACNGAYILRQDFFPPIPGNQIVSISGWQIWPDMQDWEAFQPFFYYDDGTYDHIIMPTTTPAQWNYFSTWIPRFKVLIAIEFRNTSNTLTFIDDLVVEVLGPDEDEQAEDDDEP
jgi:hypothetical protein